MRSLTSSAISCRIPATRGSAHQDTGNSRSSAAGSPPPNNSRMRSCSPASLDCPRSSPAPLRDKRGIPGSSVARCIMRMPRTLNTREHSEAPLSSLPTRMTIGRRRRAAGRANAPLRISPIARRCSDPVVHSHRQSTEAARTASVGSALAASPGPSSAFLPRLGQKRKHGPWRRLALLCRREARSRPGAAVTPWRPAPCAMPRFSLKIGPLKISRAG